ncbi:MAG: DUF481 domain-containing protein [Gammaproteobacteria bacterium]
MHPRINVLLCVLMAGTSGSPQADEVQLAAGDRLIGEIQSVDEDVVIIRTPYAEAIEVPRADVVGLRTDDVVTVAFDDGSYLTGRLVAAAPSALSLEHERTGAITPFPLSDVKAVYHGDPMEIAAARERVDLSGIANVGLDRRRGNSSTDSYHIDAELVARSPLNRYTAAFELNQQRAENVKFQDNAAGLLKYDHFLGEKIYLFNSATFERDPFQDLNLRSAVAAGFGYQFFETERRLLSLEAGPTYVDEDFETTADQQFFGLRWAANFEQELQSDDGLRFFHFQEGLLGLEDVEDVIIRTRTGLRVSVTESLRATAQYNVDWDNSPAPGNVRVDEAYLLTLGYEW